MTKTVTDKVLEYIDNTGLIETVVKNNAHALSELVGGISLELWKEVYSLLDTSTLKIGFSSLLLKHFDEKDIDALLEMSKLPIFKKYMEIGDLFRTEAFSVGKEWGEEIMNSMGEAIEKVCKENNIEDNEALEFARDLPKKNE